MINFKNGDSCPVCEVGALKERTGDFSFVYKDQQFFVKNITEFYCAECGEIFLNRGDEREVERMAIEFRRRVDGLLTPYEIKKIREQIKCTQVEFAKLLDIGEKTFARYETGAVTQSRAMDIALRLIRDDPDRAIAIICGTFLAKKDEKFSCNWIGASKTKTHSNPYTFTERSSFCLYDYEYAEVG